MRGSLAEFCTSYAWKGCKLAVSGDFEIITFSDVPTRQPGFLIKATEVEVLSPVGQGRRPLPSRTRASVRPPDEEYWDHLQQHRAHPCRAA